MKDHTKLYLETLYPNHCQGEYLPCEFCQANMVDIHHIYPRGMGGTSKDVIENLMGLCRDCHVEYGDKVLYRDSLISIHFAFLRHNGLNFTKEEEENFKNNRKL